MRAASKSRGVSKILVRPALWFCACNLLAAVLAAQCSNPTQVSNGTYTSGDHSATDNNALSASNFVISGSATATFVAGNCIQLLPGFHATAGTAGTTFHAWVETAPADVSVSPSSGSGLSQPFTWTVSSPSGYSNLSDVFALFNTAVSGLYACHIHYNRASNLLYLADNTGANWLGGFVPGSSGSAGNSYCTIYGSGSSATGAGTQLALTVSVTFQTAFAGTKNEYLIGYDNQGLNTTWQQMGTWTVATAQQYYLTTAVSPSGGGTISPASGWYNSGSPVQITATPNSGYQFTGFSGSVNSGSNPLTVTMDSAMTETANFTALPVNQTITTSPVTAVQLTVDGAPCMSPCAVSWTPGSNHTIGGPATAAPSGTPAGTQYAFSGWSDSGANPHAVTAPSTSGVFTAYYATQYYLTTSVWPPYVVQTAGTVTQSNPTGWYNAGAAVTVTASPGATFLFAGFSGAFTGMQNPQTISSISGPTTVTAYFAPTVWKGINYSPRYHSNWRMLYDWDQYNLGPTVDYDLTALSAAGFNMIHLYVWDQAVFQGVILSQPVCGTVQNPTPVCFQGFNPNEPAGFIGPDGDPALSPHNQWTHLEDFVAKARDHGIFVIIDLASAWIVGHLADFTLDSASTAAIDSKVVTPYANWVNKFVQQLGHYQNVLAWSDYWGLSRVPRCTALSNPPPSGTCFSKYSYEFMKLYSAIDTTSKQYSPAPGVLGLIATSYGSVAVAPNLSAATSGMIARPSSGYDYFSDQTYGWPAAQQMASTMRALLSQVYNYQKDPDLYNIGELYNANSWDLYNGLTNLTNGFYFQIPASKILVTEWATSSSLGPGSLPNVGYTTNAEAYNAVPAFGDWDTPTTTFSGQQAWTQNTLCAATQAGLQKLAYWWLFDPYTLYSSSPWSLVGRDLAWDGYWGLAYESPSMGNKPAWSVLQQYYQYGSLSCPGYNAAPIFSLTPQASYYTINQPVRVIWTAAEISTVSIPGATGTLTCNTEAVLSSSAVVPASCAETDAPSSSTVGNYTVAATATGTNGSTGNQATAYATVSIGSAPILNAITDASYGTIYQNDYIILWGAGFANERNQNQIQCTQGNNVITFDDGDGVGLYYQSNGQINVNLANRLAPGAWTLRVWNGYSGVWSNSYPITVYQR